MEAPRVPAGSHHLAVSLEAHQAAAKVGDPVAGQPAIGFDLRLSRAAGADPATEPFEVGP